LLQSHATCRRQFARINLIDEHPRHAQPLAPRVGAHAEADGLARVEQAVAGHGALNLRQGVEHGLQRRAIALFDQDAQAVTGRLAEFEEAHGGLLHGQARLAADSLGFDSPPSGRAFQVRVGAKCCPCA
jgi:hypothetical protein